MFNIVHAEDVQLSEIGQTIPLLFSYAKVEGDTVVRKHTYVKCRDFLGDVIWANAYEKPVDIYRFKCSKETVPLENTLQLLVKFPKSAYKDAFFSNFEHIVHGTEKSNNLSLSTITEVSGNEVVIVADGFWQQTIQGISLYSFLIKCCAYKYKDTTNWIEELHKKSGIESEYVQTLGVARLTKLLQMFTKSMIPHVNVSGFKGEEDMDVYTLHDGCGFVNTFKFQNKTNEYSRRFEELTCAA